MIDPEPEPFLSRSSGSGFVIEADWPEEDRVVVTVRCGNVVLDVLDLDHAEGLDAFHHPACYSEILARALT
jgi:hypothetical protein